MRLISGWNNVVRYRSAFVLCMLWLSGCSSVPEPANLRLSKAIEFNQRAQNAFQRGEYQTAADLYDLSLQVDSSIENVDGIAINLINLAKVHQALAQRELVQRDLDALLNEKALHFRPEHLAAAALQKAAMQLQDGDVGGAGYWLEQSAGHCTSDCKLKGAINNLRANIALLEKDAGKTLYWADQGASASKKAAPVEYANALRLAAQAKILKDDADGAKVLLEQTLAADKTLGLPQKIFLDLTLLAEVSDMKGDVEVAKQYRARATRVATPPTR